MTQRKQQSRSEDPSRPSAAGVGRRQLIVLTIFFLGALPLGRAALGSLDAFAFWWLALLTIAASLFGIRLPLKQKSGAITITVSDCFIFLALFLYGVNAAVIVAVLDAVTVCLKVCWRSWEKLLFNIGQMSISVFVAGSAFWITQGTRHPLEIRASSLLTATLQILACVVLYYALSSFMIGLVASACGELPMRYFFPEYFLKLSPATILSVLAAVAVLLPLSQPITLLLAAVLMGSSYLWARHRASQVLLTT